MTMGAAGVDVFVSVILPAYNRAGCLADAIDSVLHQTFTNWELIVVDDGSTDGTLETATRYESRHPDRITVLSQANMGVAIARNNGIRRSRGTHVAFIDSDDRWHPEKLERQIAVWRGAPNVAFVYSGYHVVDESGELQRIMRPDSRFQGDVSELLWTDDNEILGATLLIPREHLFAVGLFDETLRGAENLDLRLKLARRGPVRFVDTPLYDYRKHAGSLTADGEAMLAYTRAMIRSHFDGQEGPATERRRRQVLSTCAYREGNLHFARMRYRQAIQSYARSWRGSRRKGELLVRMMRCLLGARANSWLRALKGHRTALKTSSRLSRAVAIAIALFGLAACATAGPARPAPPLPRPVGRVVRVSTESQLQSAVATLASNTTIVITPGIYRLTKTLYIKGTFANVAVRGSTNSADDVQLVGSGMTTASYGEVPYGIWTGGSVKGVTIANLTIRDVYLHAIILNPGTVSPHLYNVRLVNAGQQFVKANPDNAGGGVDDGLVEYAVIEYDARSRDNYTNGIDVHTGRNWVIRNSLFRNIRAPQGALAGPAILMWNGSANSTVDGNTFINCQREIAFGLNDRAPFDHSGGSVRNNVIYRDRSVTGDAAIGVFASPNTQVLHNTILVSGTFPNPIEYRFARTTGVVIRNNLLDGEIHARDGAMATVAGNFTRATAALFVNAGAGDLRLVSTAAATVGDAGAPDVASAAPVDDRGVRRTGSTPAQPLLQQGDLVYKGAFRLPAGTFGGSTFEYGGTAMAYNPAHDSLFMVGHDQHQLVAEIAIPSPVNATTLNRLATARVLQPFADPTDGTLNTANPSDPNVKKIGGLMVSGGKLYGTVYSSYDASKSQVVSHFVRPTDLSRRGETSGFYQVGTVGAGFVAGYMAPVPAPWQRALGGPALTGQCCLNIISRTSYGPAAFVFDPADLGRRRPVPVSPLEYYPMDHHTLGDWNVTSPVFNGSTQMGGVVFPEGARSVLFFGRQGIGPFCYGDASTGCVDPADPYKGTHAYRYVYQVWAYDAQDLAAVKAGLRQPWNVTPYATWQLTLPFADQNAQIRGAAYDPATGRLWISQARGDGQQPLVYLFTVAAPAASALSTRP